MGTLNDILNEAKPEVVIFDPAYLMMDGEAVENVMKMGAQLRNIMEVCIRHKATMILAHHFTKGSQKTEKGKPLPMPDLNDLSWSGFAEFARQWILLNRPVPYRSGSGEHKLNMVIGGSVGHGCECVLEVKEGRRRDPDGNTLERIWLPTVKEWTEDAMAERDQQVENGRKDKIRQCLIENPEGLIIRDISQETGISGKILKKLLADMGNTKEIQEVPAVGQNKQKTVKYVLLAGPGVADFCESFRSNNETPTDAKPAKKRAVKKAINKILSNFNRTRSGGWI